MKSLSTRSVHVVHMSWPGCLFFLSVMVVMNAAGLFCGEVYGMDKPKIIVTTDGEVDDKSSAVRLLAHANDFEILGLIYSNSRFHPHGEGTTWWQDEHIARYGQYYNNLIIHDPDYPTPQSLTAVVKNGIQPGLAMSGVGAGKDTEGSNFIISQIDSHDGPIYLQAWGGGNTIAQALWRVRNDRTTEQVDAFAAKIGAVYVIDEYQDTTSNDPNQNPNIWARTNFPIVPYVVNQGTFDAMRGKARWGNDPVLAPSPWFDSSWMSANVKTNHGSLGSSYRFSDLSEGDTPSFMYFMDSGLISWVHPTYGGWGGRFYLQSSPNYWKDINGTVGGIPWYEIFRWQQPDQNASFHNEFQARMDYFVQSSFSGANHPPAVSCNIPEGKPHQMVLPGQSVSLSASGTTDPDGNNLSYRWWKFQDAGENPYGGGINISGADSINASFTVPGSLPADLGRTFHIILQVWDDGNPVLTRYHRMVFEITDTPPIEPPSNLQVVSSSGDHVALCWQDNSSDPQEDSFVIQRRPYMGSDVWQDVGTVGQNETCYTDTDNLYGMVEYTYRVGAVKN